MMHLTCGGETRLNLQSGVAQCDKPVLIGLKRVLIVLNQATNDPKRKLIT